MNRFRDQSALIDRVSLYDLRSYLEKTGWLRTISENGKWQIFSLGRDTKSSLELILPVSDNFSDIHERIFQTISSISQIEDRGTADVCSDIVGTNTDSLLIRLEVDDGISSIPIENASKHVKAIRNLLLYSACSEIDSRSHFEQPLPPSHEFLSGFEFCHTFRGSFGFEVSNIVAKQFQTEELFDRPINRRIVERIARGLLLLEDAVKRDDPEILIRSYRSALNSRMCDAISDIGIDGRFAYKLGIDWASTIKPSEDVSLFKEQKILEHHVRVLNHASEQLKIVKPQLVGIVGYVVNLHCATNPEEGHARRSVAIKVDHLTHGMIEVKLSLDSALYLRCIEAHSKGKRLSACGQLQRKGNTWSLESISSLNILEI